MDYNKEFDGIKQTDNPMPEWWKLFFGIAVVFAWFIPFTSIGFPNGKWKTTSIRK